MAKKGRFGQMEQMNKLRRDTTRPYRCRCANPYNAENAIVPFNFPRFIFLRVIAEQDWTCGIGDVARVLLHDSLILFQLQVMTRLASDASECSVQLFSADHKYVTLTSLPKGRPIHTHVIPLLTCSALPYSPLWL